MEVVGDEGVAAAVFGIAAAIFVFAHLQSGVGHATMTGS